MDRPKQYMGVLTIGKEQHMDRPKQYMGVLTNGKKQHKDRPSVYLYHTWCLCVFLCIHMYMFLKLIKRFTLQRCMFS